MQRQKRQIIKTRPQRPYIIARIILILVAIAAIAVSVFELVSHQHPAHAAMLHSLAISTLWQEGSAAKRSTPIPVFAERERS